MNVKCLIKSFMRTLYKQDRLSWFEYDNGNKYFFMELRKRPFNFKYYKPNP